MDVPQRDLPRLRRRLLRWYDAHRRDLPWRRQPRNAYLQWLAEIMLQQTQVATAVPYFNKFIERFPDVHRLAAAPLEDVLHAWAGLGYYARARNLHRTARIVDARGGHFPDNAADLEDLPGIGKYTARALASIAYDRPVAAVDGNVRRVLARLHGVTGDLSRGPASHRIWALAEQLMPRRRCGDFNQAMMELGATVCTPQRPGCHRCPWAKLCCEKRRGVQHRIPQGGRRTRPNPGTLVVAGVEHRRSLLLRRRPPQGPPAATARADRGHWVERGVTASSSRRSRSTTVGSPSTSSAVVPSRPCTQSCSCSVVPNSAPVTWAGPS